jgi:exonuclease VII large subunit
VGWFLDLVEDQADNTVSCARLSCSVSHAVLRRIGDELRFPLDPTLLIGSVALLKVKPTFHPRYQLGLRLLGVNGNLAAGLLNRRIDQIRAALEGEGIFDLQHQLAAPPDATRIAVIHPDASASWSDVEAELQRWQAQGILTVEPIPAAFEGARDLVAAQGAKTRPGSRQRRQDRPRHGRERRR